MIQPPHIASITTTLCLLTTICVRAKEAVHFPGTTPGPANAEVTKHLLSLNNDALSFRWLLQNDRLMGGGIELRPAHFGRAEQFRSREAFLIIANSNSIPASSLRIVGKPEAEDVRPAAGTARLSESIPGKAIRLRLEEENRLFRVEWRALLRTGAGYAQEEIAVTSMATNLQIQEIIVMEADMIGAQVMGTVDGSPVVSGSGRLFFGCENPMARASVTANQSNSAASHLVQCRLPWNATLHAGETIPVSAVFGIAPPGQMRRAFLHYIERERAHPFRPFLHYNSWYDTAWNPFALNETNCLEAIRLMGERFVKRHGVVLDGMVFDDGWDNPKSLWKFHSGFPHGFTPLAAACKEYGARLGVWLSPFGGYATPKSQRLQFGREQGYEINDAGFSLAGPKYYAAFKDACMGMMRHYGVNHFKFDGIALGLNASGGGQFALDTEAMRRLMLDLRKEDPNVYVNLTTGSWPSPFWLRYADSIWRQGEDMGHAGKGPKQQRWLTFRDSEVYSHVVRKGPLFPLSSLMTQGVAYSRHGMAGDPTFNSAGFKDDVRAFFGSGTGLQELYIQPDKLTTTDWAVLAEAAKWARSNSDVFVDTHWIGGDPSKSEAYGYASWNARKGIVMLRNPGELPAKFDLDVARAFELPDGAAAQYRLKSPWAENALQPEHEAKSGAKLQIALKPFEIVVFDAIPIRQQER